MRAWSLGASLLLLAALERPAAALPREVYWESGGGYLGGPARVVAGYGGGLGYQQHVTDALALHVEARWLLLLGNAFAGSAGLSYGLHRGSWAPRVGAQLTAYMGSQLRVVSSAQPELPRPVILATELRVQPLRFVLDNVSASVLGVDAGAGFERSRAIPAFHFALLQMGYQF